MSPHKEPTWHAVQQFEQQFEQQFRSQIKRTPARKLPAPATPANAPSAVTLTATPSKPSSS
ncbi:MAG: hypothetical protein WAL86_12360, partial [Candidatus Acidiferrales bacterium]